MSGSSIYSREAQVDTLNKLTKEHETMLNSCVDGLKAIIGSKEISESNLRQLINIWRELDALRELFYLRILNSCKRGDKILY